jgi:hypothetical protein
MSAPGSPAASRSLTTDLTERGRELFERVVPAHLANERRLLSALDDEQLDALAGLLRKLLVEFEGSRRPADATLELGLTLAPAHVTAALREAVGLPVVVGLLVRAVGDGSPAAAAGLRTGDVLTHAGRRELRAVADLYAALDDGAADGRLRLELVRGAEQHRATFSLASGPGDGRHARPRGRARRRRRRARL